MSRWYAQRFPVPPWRYRLEAAAEQRMRDFNSQELANTAWAFATVGHKKERLFTALAAVPPFSSVWVTSPWSKNPCPFLFGHIF